VDEPAGDRGTALTARVVRGGVDVVGRRLDGDSVDGLVASTGGAREGGAARPGRPVLDATGLVVVPGLLDLQVNGVAGVDITAEPHRMWDVAAALVRYGVTAFLPTVITSTPETRSAAVATLAAGRPDGVPAGAVPLGLHFEGPMLAPSRKGAHRGHWLAQPSLELVEGWSAGAGVAMVTLAPELPGALEVIRALVARGVVVSLGHTAATTSDVEAAVAAGATSLTHLYNAMPPMGHRDPGPVGVALGGVDLTAGVIVDGHHLDPRAVVVAWRSLRPDRFVAVSDSTAVLGLGGGRHRLGDQDVEVERGEIGRAHV
jgi:N-acetylglucosamine-6-phosphate deacetylase